MTDDKTMVWQVSICSTCGRVCISALLGAEMYGCQHSPDNKGYYGFVYCTERELRERHEDIIKEYQDRQEQYKQDCIAHRERIAKLRMKQEVLRNASICN